MKRLTKKDADKIFELVQNMEDLHWANMCDLEYNIVKPFGENYELAIVDGQVVGIGKITRKGQKIVFHR